jgi:hypothetical protein
VTTYVTPGARHCRCEWLGEGTPEHDASALCVSLRPEADRDPEPGYGPPGSHQARLIASLADPCAAGCSNPAMHAEGGHDV